MAKHNNDIKSNYKLFEELLSVNKEILIGTIKLTPKNSNVMWLVGSTGLKHDTHTHDMEMIVERSKRDSKYGVKLRCPSYTAAPFFRFDSDGPAHRNDFPDIPLDKQLITTPHFNSFRSNGQPYAYKNQVLEDEKQAEAIVNDITFGVSMFCQETNCNLPSGEYPEIMDQVPELPFTGSEDINFDNIKFD